MKLILSSCDFGNSCSAKVINDNLEKPIEHCKVLYFPNENANREAIESNKYYDRLEKFGFVHENIYVFNYYNCDKFRDLKIDIIYISGGNTFGTMKRIRECSFEQEIIRYIQNGVIYIGGSAGAHIASMDISHVVKYDKDTYGLDNFVGLKLFPGILVCHYCDERKSDYERLTKESKFKVGALTDQDSIVFEDE